MESRGRHLVNLAISRSEQNKNYPNHNVNTRTTLFQTENNKNLIFPDDHQELNIGISEFHNPVKNTELNIVHQVNDGKENEYVEQIEMEVTDADYINAETGETKSTFLTASKTYTVLSSATQSYNELHSKNNLSNDIYEEFLSENDKLSVELNHYLKEPAFINTYDSDRDSDYVLPNDCDSTTSNDSDATATFYSKNVPQISNRPTAELINQFPNTPSTSTENPMPAEGQLQVTICEETKFRKRTRNPDKWKTAVAKKKRNVGDSYISASGKTVKCRSIKPPCGEKCRLKCSTKIGLEQRKLFFQQYWKLGDVNRQRDFICRSMKSLDPPYRRAKEGSTRSKNYAYFFEIGNTKIRVCKTFFLQTLDISSRIVVTTLAKKTNENFVYEDKRGRHQKHYCIDQQIKDDIYCHISSFQAIESHYCRRDSSKVYIDGGLTIASMYRMYVEGSKKANKPFGKLHLYESIFNTKFNISFFSPKKDQCSLCEQYKNANDVDKVQLKGIYDKHQSEKLLSRKEKENDIQLYKTPEPTNQTLVCCFDLQSVLPTPSGDISSFYYKRRLSVYNFTIFDIINKQGWCYLWHEAIANRGANDIGTCVYQFLKNECKGKNVIFYSDNCAGQQKNKFLASLYLYCVHKLNIDSVTHKFLITGHTQNEGDSMHALIEKEKKRFLKSGPIYLPSQWSTLIQGCKKSGSPYKIRELCSEDFIDLKDLTNQMGKNFTLDEEGNKIIWNDIKVLRFHKDSLHTVMYKTSYESNEFKVFNVRNKQRGRFPEPKLKPAYTTSPAISELKKKDLISLCESNVIPRIHWDFYKSLKSKKENEQREINDIEES